MLSMTLSGSPTERIQSVPAGTPISCLMGTPGVVKGRAESVVKNTLLTAAPMVLNCSCVDPFTVWNTLELTPPEVRPVTSAATPVARAAPPKTAPRPWEAAPPTRPCMTSPSPRLTLLMPKSVRVDVRVTFVSIKTELMFEVLIVDTTKLGALRVLTVRVEVNMSCALI